MNRPLLLKHLKSAWSETIRGAYQQRLINSERGLQVHFCAALLEAFAACGKSRSIFVEPHLRLVEKSQSIFPDLLICSSRTIIGVVELKYQPRTGPSTKKDIATLKSLAGRPHGLLLTNERFCGPATPAPVYSLSPTAVLCWAGVYLRSEALDLRPLVSESLLLNLLQFHAVTSPERVPQLFCGIQNANLRKLGDDGRADQS